VKSPWRETRDWLLLIVAIFALPNVFLVLLILIIIDWRIPATAAIGIAAVGVLGQHFSDRRRRNRAGRGLCLACGYNLTGNISGICPECGTGIGHSHLE
jgi:hypothetical protein